MPFILMKNNLKLMLRNKWILILMTLLPVLVIVFLSSAFEDMMSHVGTVGDFKAGYFIEGQSPYRMGVQTLKEECLKAGITLQEYPREEAEELLKDGKIAAFLSVEGDAYQVLKTRDAEMEGMIAEGIFTSFFDAVDTKINQMLLFGGAQAEGDHLEETEYVLTKYVPVEPVPESKDYYGIIEIVYFAWCGIVSLAVVISSERKNNILKRMHIAKMGKFQLFLGKMIPCSAAVYIEVLLGWGFSVLLVGNHWGNVFVSAGILLLLSIASSAVGILLMQMFKSVAVSIIVSFSLTWIMGFIGGTFQSYRFDGFPEWLHRLSPVYYVNRVLVDYELGIQSRFLLPCILVLLGITVLCSMGGTLLINRKTEG